MLLQIPEILSAEQLKSFCEVINKADLIGDKMGNQQLPHASEEAKSLGNQVMMSLEKNPTFISAALPLKIFPPVFNVYSNNEEVGADIDGAIRQVPGTPFRVRSDISATVFLSDIADYDGGELLIEDAYGTHKVKLPAGHMIIYPSDSLKCIKPVTRGKRVYASIWIESMVREGEKRSVLFELDNSIRSLKEDVPGHDSISHLTGVYHNLLRRWANT